MKALKDGIGGERTVAAVEIQRLAEQVAGHSQSILEVMESKLRSVAREEAAPCKGDACSEIAPYPPLFSSIEAELISIRRNLERMGNVLDRVELESY